MKARAKRVRKPPDLTSLFDVMFIVVFVALIRAAAAQQALAETTRPPPPKPTAPQPPADVAALQQTALANLDAELAQRTPLVIRVAATGTIEALEVDGKRIALDVPLLEHSADPDVAVAYLGDRSSELRLCRVAALHLGLAGLAHHLVIVAPARPLADLPHALYDGLHRDLDRCLADQRGLATLVDPAVTIKP